MWPICIDLPKVFPFFLFLLISIHALSVWLPKYIVPLMVKLTHGMRHSAIKVYLLILASLFNDLLIPLVIISCSESMVKHATV